MKSRSWFAGLQMPELLGGVERHLGKEGVRGSGMGGVAVGDEGGG